jgi:hypothetical protein
MNFPSNENKATAQNFVPVCIEMVMRSEVDLNHDLTYFSKRSVSKVVSKQEEATACFVLSRLFCCL